LRGKKKRGRGGESGSASSLPRHAEENTPNVKGQRGKKKKSPRPHGGKKQAKKKKKGTLESQQLGTEKNQKKVMGPQ